MPQTSFGVGDKLYVDFFLHPQASDGHWTGDPIVTFISNSGTAGVANDFVITTPGYNSPVNKDVTVRGRLSAVANKDITTRAKLSTSAKHDITFRGNIGNSAKKDVTVRAVLSGVTWHDVITRAKVSTGAKHDVTVRGLVGALIRKDATVRGRLSAQVWKDVTTRARVSAKANKDIIFRGNVIARNTSGGGTLWAKGTGTATFDNFRWTIFPDPSLSLAPVLPQVNTSEVFWTENVPTNTSRTMYTSLDGVSFTDVTSGNGSAIPGITGQGTVQTDLWTSNTSANYTSTNKTGGSTATWTYDTANSRITATGGSGALYVLNAVSSNKIDALCDMDKSDAGGLVWGFNDTSDYYELGVYDDSSSSGFTNQLRLYKVASNTRSLLSSATITFNRATSGISPYHRIRVTMNAAGVINVFFDSLTALFSYTDNSPLGAGKAGLRNDGGTSRYYQLRIQALGDYVGGTPVGDIVTAKCAYSEQSLSTTDPTQSQQIFDNTLAVRSPDVDSGSLIPQLHDPTIPFASMYNSEFDTLAQSSGDYHWQVGQNSFASFSLRGSKIAPWILSSTDLLFTTVTPTSSADLYCNRIKITNCLYLTATQTEQKVADGSTSSWTMAYPLYSAPTVTVSGVVQTVGIRGTDTGKAFYWQSGSTSISQDPNATKIASGVILTFVYIGTYVGTVTRDNTAEQAARAAIEGNSGIVEVIIDGATIFGSRIQVTAPQAQVYGDGYLARFGNNNAVTLSCTTSRAGLAKGMLLPVQIPEHGLINRQLLITRLVTTAVQKADSNVQYFYALEATDGASIQQWFTALRGF